jgi:hypothetical protein
MRGFNISGGAVIGGQEKEVLREEVSSSSLILKLRGRRSAVLHILAEWSADVVTKRVESGENLHLRAYLE